MAGRRGRRFGIVVVVLLLIAAGLLALSDRLAVYAAERTALPPVLREM